MKLLTLARDLQRRKARERHGLFVAEGARTVEELVRSPLAMRGVLIAPALASVPRGPELRAAIELRAIEILDVSDRDFATAAGTESPQGILAIAEAPTPSLDALALRALVTVLVLDGIQDPGNLGTILRTAAAFGATATVAMPGTADVWNAKVVRSAAGALFHHPPIALDWGALDAFLHETKTSLWGADARGTALGDESRPARLALAVGNEGAGLSAEARARCQRTIAIPIAADVESLNVAVATGILLHHYREPPT